MEEELKRVECLIERCNQCKLNACISCDICWSEVQAIKELLEQYKHIKRINSDLQGEQEQLYDKLDKLEEENRELLEVKISASAHNRITELEKENSRLYERAVIAEGNLKQVKK